MVGEGELSEAFGVELYFFDQRLWRCDAGDEEYMLLTAQHFGQGTFGYGLWKYGYRHAITYACEVKLLEGIQVELLPCDIEVDRLDVLRTLGDDDYLCTGLARGGFAQPSCGQQAVFGEQAVVVGQQNI